MAKALAPIPTVLFTTVTMKAALRVALELALGPTATYFQACTQMTECMGQARFNGHQAMFIWESLPWIDGMGAGL
jgi:hypothetical protein